MGGRANVFIEEGRKWGNEDKKKSEGKSDNVWKS